MTSGLRIGTPAVTTRGFGESECRDLAGWMCDILDNLEDDAVNVRVREQVGGLCSRFLRRLNSLIAPSGALWGFA